MSRKTVPEKISHKKCKTLKQRFDLVSRFVLVVAYVFEDLLAKTTLKPPWSGAACALCAALLFAPVLLVVLEDALWLPATLGTVGCGGFIYADLLLFVIVSILVVVIVIYGRG